MTPTPQIDQQQEKYKKLYDQVLERDYTPLKIFIEEGEDESWMEKELELNSRDVFRSFCQNEYEAEKEFTIACLKYYWGEIPTICSYLFNQKPV